MPARSSASVFCPSRKFRCWWRWVRRWRPARFWRCCSPRGSRPPTHPFPTLRVRSLSVPALPTAAAPTCMVWLPGAYHGAQDFLAAGFAEAVRTRRTALDLIFVDLELAHVGDRSALQRLRSDIVLPARSARVSNWLGGISFV